MINLVPVPNNIFSVPYVTLCELHTQILRGNTVRNLIDFITSKLNNATKLTGIKANGLVLCSLVPVIQRKMLR